MYILTLSATSFQTDIHYKTMVGQKSKFLVQTAFQKPL